MSYEDQLKAMGLDPGYMKHYGESGKGQRRVAALARAKGFRLYSGHAYGCAHAMRGGYAYKPFWLIRDDDWGNPVLDRATLAEAEAFLKGAE